MPFEFKIKRKIIFNQPGVTRLSQEEVIEKLEQYFQKKLKLPVRKEKNTITCYSNKSLLYYEYKSVFTIEKNKNLTVWYEYSLIPVFKITVIMILFAAFFSKFSVNSLLIFSGAFIVIFFAFNILHINSVLKNQLIDIFLPESKNMEEKLTDEQREWISNPMKCPACGEEISDYNFICPECGISINKKNKHKKTNLSGFYQTKFKYKYKPSK
ncbi:MAG: hypothetical protein GXO79_13570 [Chlorobi bacterium]|nr:hypothetical protein [Chlorobiota bacterium]